MSVPFKYLDEFVQMVWGDAHPLIQTLAQIKQSYHEFERTSDDMLSEWFEKQSIQDRVIHQSAGSKKIRISLIINLIKHLHIYQYRHTDENENFAICEIVNALVERLLLCNEGRPRCDVPPYALPRNYNELQVTLTERAIERAPVLTYCCVVLSIELLSHRHDPEPIAICGENALNTLRDMLLVDYDDDSGRETPPIGVTQHTGRISPLKYNNTLQS